MIEDEYDLAADLERMLDAEGVIAIGLSGHIDGGLASTAGPRDAVERMVTVA